MGRDKLDFGPGFYVGDSQEQTMLLCSSAPNPVFYTYALDLRGLTTLTLAPDIEWALLVACNRGQMPADAPRIIREYFADIQSVDVIIGPIADDKLFRSLSGFFDGLLTDEALVASLDSMRLGNQYALKTATACGHLALIGERHPSAAELRELTLMSSRQRESAERVTEMVSRQYRRKGYYIDEVAVRFAQEIEAARRNAAMTTGGHPSWTARQ